MNKMRVGRIATQFKRYTAVKNNINNINGHIKVTCDCVLANIGPGKNKFDCHFQFSTTRCISSVHLLVITYLHYLCLLLLFLLLTNLSLVFIYLPLSIFLYFSLSLALSVLMAAQSIQKIALEKLMIYDDSPCTISDQSFHRASSPLRWLVKKKIENISN